jgi:hypothetical protein
MSKVTRWRALAAGLAVLAATSCGSGGTPVAAPPTPAAGGPLAGVCPDPVVVQTDWFPEAEYGAYFEMLGDAPQFDTNVKKATAPLVDGGAPTGVGLEIRYGGAAIGFQQVSAQLYADKAITLGLV